MTSLENMVISVAPEDDNKPVLNLKTDDPSAADIVNKPSVNFGGCIELLMNDKKKPASTEIGLGELSDLENELNNLSSDVDQLKTVESSKSSIFNDAINSVKPVDITGVGSGSSAPDIKLNTESGGPDLPNIATASAQSLNDRLISLCPQ